MERLTTRHNGVAVIKDKSKHKEAMEKLARYEELEEQEEECKKYWDEFDDEDAFGGMNAYMNSIAIIKQEMM